MARRWINSMDVEVGANGAPLFDVAGCASFVGGTKTVPSAGTPQGRALSLRSRADRHVHRPRTCGADLLTHTTRILRMMREKP